MSLGAESWGSTQHVAAKASSPPIQASPFVVIDPGVFVQDV